jgi:mevalonate kinase
LARANGKVILLGEHAVVYGACAIAASIERGVRALAVPAVKAKIRVGERTASADDGSELGRALTALLSALAAEPFAIEIELDLPAGAGLGASAAIGVAAARAVLEAQGAAPADALVLAAADAWERVFHGNPSGIDAAAAAHTGCLSFSRSEGVQPLPVGRTFHLAVALAGPPASTREMVAGVARLRERRPEVVNAAIDGIQSLVQNAKVCIETGDLVGLGRLMDLNQMILSGLFVSTDDIERVCAVARENGALGAKLTGAGGGGAVIALCDPDPVGVLEGFKAAGVQCFAATVRAGGPAP